MGAPAVDVNQEGVGAAKERTTFVHVRSA